MHRMALLRDAGKQARIVYLPDVVHPYQHSLLGGSVDVDQFSQMVDMAAPVYYGMPLQAVCQLVQNVGVIKIQQVKGHGAI